MSLVLIRQSCLFDRPSPRRRSFPPRRCCTSLPQPLANRIHDVEKGQMPVRTNCEESTPFLLLALPKHILRAVQRVAIFPQVFLDEASCDVQRSASASPHIKGVPTLLTFVRSMHLSVRPHAVFLMMTMCCPKRSFPTIRNLVRYRLVSVGRQPKRPGLELSEFGDKCCVKTLARLPCEVDDIELTAPSASGGWITSAG